MCREEDFIGVDVVLLEQCLCVCLALIVMVEVAIGAVLAAAEGEELAAVAFRAVHPWKVKVSSSAVGHVAGVLHVLVAVLDVLPLAVVCGCLVRKRVWWRLYHRLISTSFGLSLCGDWACTILYKCVHTLLV